MNVSDDVAKRNVIYIRVVNAQEDGTDDENYDSVHTFIVVFIEEDFTLKCHTYVSFFFMLANPIGL